ncbi:MarR family winged helix-turn-helix transcriptional regulator [Cryobacterium sp. GrIS_2_6]|uniref:MarR family winged helix-turn-helix transcriptional regulator n=1 Tax=Cryobacterium sp. GrIS_2_6 TaxID=3162785 RepID=UPI002DFC3215|nr:DNA-binding MarR family transcriptional regulator [Cryobacterium psychrotolerans]
MSERATFPPRSPSPEPSFWIGQGNTAAPGATGARDVLAALRAFRAADAAMRERARAELAVNETDLVAIRHLIQREARRTPVSPKDLTAHLGISSAATSKLLARLTRTGHIRREAHAVDGRVQLIFATPAAHQEVRRALGGVHERMFAAAEDLEPSERHAVVRFLTAVADAMSATKTDSASHHGGSPTGVAAPSGGTEAVPGHSTT